jgi:hypothetical protein
MSIQAPSREIPWADTAAQGDMVEPSDGSKGSGWTGTPAPPYQWFNWILRQAARWVKYLRARGIPDYCVDEDYDIRDRVQSEGYCYVCIQANGHAAPKSPASEPTYWMLWAPDVYGFAQIPTQGDVVVTHGTLVACHMLTVPSLSGGGYGGSGFKEIGMKITDLEMTYGCVLVKLQGTAAMIPGGNIAWSVNYADDIAGTTAAPVVTGPDQNGLWTISFPINAANGSHPGLFVRVTALPG